MTQATVVVATAATEEPVADDAHEGPHHKGWLFRSRADRLLDYIRYHDRMAARHYRTQQILVDHHRRRADFYESLLDAEETA
jgi:hypothetical protein